MGCQLQKYPTLTPERRRVAPMGLRARVDRWEAHPTPSGRCAGTRGLRASPEVGSGIGLRIKRRRPRLTIFARIWAASPMSSARCASDRLTELQRPPQAPDASPSSRPSKPHPHRGPASPQGRLSARPEPSATLWYRNQRGSRNRCLHRLRHGQSHCVEDY